MQSEGNKSFNGAGAPAQTGGTFAASRPGVPPGQHIGDINAKKTPSTITYESPAPAPPGGSNKMLLGISVAGLALVAFGIGKSFFGAPAAAPAAPAASAPSFFSEQQNMMREAMDMARQAQQLQREHMAQMRRAMEEAEGGPVGMDAFPGR